MKHPIAQTNLQLYNQMQAAGYSDEDLAFVRNAYEFGIEVFTARYVSSRRVFIEHGIGSASVLVQIGEPAMMVAAGILHNVFWNGVWKDGLKGITNAKREEVRQRLGDDIVPCLERFHDLRWNEETVADLLLNFDDLDQTTYQTILLRLADHIDHLLDGGLMYSVNAAARLRRAESMLAPMESLAEKMGYPELGVELRALTEQSAAMKIAPSLVGRGEHYSSITPPRTYRMSTMSWLRQAMERGIGIRKTMRALFKGGKNS